MGPNIKPFPRGHALEDNVEAEVVLVCGDNITTDDIMPSDSRLLPYRSNVPHLANYCFEKIDSQFASRAKAAQAGPRGGGAIIGGDNYGQGSSREHAALAPLYLGIRFVLAKSFARIHRANLINSGILPLVFDEPADAARITQGTALVIENAKEQIDNEIIIVKDADRNASCKFINSLNEAEKKMILAGGKINSIRQEA
jgi:aconitate hydratase